MGSGVKVPSPGGPVVQTLVSMVKVCGNLDRPILFSDSPFIHLAAVSIHLTPAFWRANLSSVGSCTRVSPKITWAGIVAV